MKILVQKFGGTSVATEERRSKAADKIIKSKRDGYSPIVVVSAMGRGGDPYATDTLLGLVKSTSEDSDKREMDMVMACGEIISCNVFCSMLRSKGVACSSLTGGQAGIITDDNFGNASIIKVETERLYNLLKNGIIPVVAGFQGITEDGDITTIGRGGSDTTAAVIGEAIKAEEIQIYTDVGGIMTADPRIVPDARVIKTMSYNEVFQLADMGAKVIHPRAVEFAMRGNIPIVIKNTMSDEPGTYITNYYKDGISSPLVTGITYMANRTQIYIENKNGEYFDDEKLFTALAQNKISIDLINVFPTHKVFTIDDECTQKTEYILKQFDLKYSKVENCSKISVIGSLIRGVPGIMARIIKALKSENIEILQTSDSHTTIWCLVRDKDTAKAINALHSEFNLSKVDKMQ
ncbi:MAG TPA: aspartate kinase [Clostridiaceae bacterium]|nr:aspartate kinase [Clostridiaceae bacterium]